jgi:uncharacterized protein DUF6455
VNNLAIMIVILIIVLIALKLTYEICRNVIVGRKFRDRLMSRLEQLPIIKMLGKHEIDVNKYLHSVPIVDIEKQLHNCNECSSKKECRETLEQEGKAEAAYSFCPNDEDFKQLERSENTSKQVQN